GLVGGDADAPRSSHRDRDHRRLNLLEGGGVPPALLREERPGGLQAAGAGAGRGALGAGRAEVRPAIEHLRAVAPDLSAPASAAARDFAAIWRAADKVVFSTTLDAVSSARTRIERVFDPDMVRRMKDLADRDITVGGPDLAGQAIQAGLVDECHLFVSPIVVGAGKLALPDNVRVSLETLDACRFGHAV